MLGLTVSLWERKARHNFPCKVGIWGFGLVSFYENKQLRKYKNEQDLVQKELMLGFLMANCLEILEFATIYLSLRLGSGVIQ